MGGLFVPQFWLHLAMLVGAGSLIVNPSRWCLLGSAHATGGASDSALTVAFIAGGIFVLAYSIPVIKAFLNKKEEYLAYCTVAALVCGLFIWCAMAAGVLVVDTWVDWAWIGQLIVCLWAALAIMVNQDD